MKSRGLTRSALAEKIGTSPAYITKILRGDTNFTLDSMVKIANVLNCDLTIGLHPQASATSPESRSKINYRDSTPLRTPVLNDEPQD